MAGGKASPPFPWTAQLRIQSSPQPHRDGLNPEEPWLQVYNLQTDRALIGHTPGKSLITDTSKYPDALFYFVGRLFENRRIAFITCPILLSSQHMSLTGAFEHTSGRHFSQGSNDPFATSRSEHGQ